MANWRSSLEDRWVEWKQVEQAVNRTLAGRSVLKVAGPRTPGMSTPAAKTVPSRALATVGGTYEAGLACFCLGELTGEERSAFLRSWHERLKTGATAVVADRRAEGCGTAFELHELFAPEATGLDIKVGRTFWWARYERR